MTSGRSPDGSGSRPSDRAADGVSPVSASISSAEVILSLPWRDIATVPRDGTIVAVWCREWNKPDGNPIIQFAQWLDPHLTGGKLGSPYNTGNEPYAYGWLPPGEVYAANASAIEAQRGETEGLDAKHERAAAKPDAQTVSPTNTSGEM